MSAIEKTGVKRKAVVGQRQLLRRVKEEKLKVLSEIQTSNSDVDSNYETVNSEPSCSQLPCLPSTVSTSNVYNDNSIDSDCEPFVSTEVSQIDNVDCEPSVNTEVSQPTLSMNEYVSQETENSGVDLKSQLRHWATVQYKIPHNAIDSLLKILSPICPELPKDSRTLLQTPKHVETLSLESGELVYIGLLIQLKSQLKLLGHTKIDKREILISFNVDGLPLFKSSNVQLWPILGLIKNYTNAKPFAIAIFCGRSKPSPLNLFLKDFVKELTELLEIGFDFESIHYSVKVHSFVCDAPARAFLKCTKSHGGYSSCDKCVEPGEYVQGRVIYKNVCASKRTNLQFRLRSDEDHHLGESLLLDLPIDLITAFPVDYMHAVLLGVMRKLLNIWIGGKLAVRLCSRLVLQISEKLLSCKKSIPIEFNRRPRSLNELARWKATEFRLFLLYLGPFVLKEILPTALYKNFILLHCAITILCSQKHINSIGIDFAHELLLMFIKHSQNVYGISFLIYNVHMMCHVSDDVRIYGVLDNYSAFPFENYLGGLKKLVRSPKYPLQQIVKRLRETEFSSYPKCNVKENLSLPYDNYLGPNLNGNNVYEFYKKGVCKDFLIYVYEYRKSDCYCLTNKNKIIEIHSIMRHIIDKTVFVYGKEFIEYNSLYNYPFDSAGLDIFILSNLTELKILPIDDIVCKCVVLPNSTDDNFICFPMIHCIL